MLGKDRVGEIGFRFWGRLALSTDSHRSLLGQPYDWRYLPIAPDPSYLTSDALEV